MKKYLILGLSAFFTVSANAQFVERDVLGAKLFNVAIDEIDDSRIGLNIDYNTWKAPYKAWDGKCWGYDGGHSGIDMQTKDVAGAKTANRKFYSLSPGKVIKSGNDKYNTIAIYNAEKNLTYLYLHARTISVNVGDTVKVGDRLGVQGSVGAGDAEHVHFEVREGKRTGPACGAVSTINPESNTIDYLVPFINSFEDIYGEVKAGDWKYYRTSFSVAPGAELKVDLTGMSRNADLYLRDGSLPLKSAKDCYSDNPWGINESCSVSTGTWFIGIYGNESTSFTLSNYIY
ncbi:hypothetical protein CBQ28_04495 [Pseudoalteromonas sp. GCY]|uniref:peptidoglycan DD-metalloendopeptidase family protein n=1 Tax=Pseudoalteromonas sp. GCY TaxID=2003316 RepID=UPI000BFF157D|nr:peptidoglycan DD-metalloendopeptidase family protein [Pseudoalteromonas sp. GCY]PHI38346.1 hypothetical protein CBQ28_04495 [Pseudoalteromonas sp. GCY]QQQ65659.1 peptidoglycan DD-metalloendopeptidase family protein [Pseudoalteromonas sp. GCY]